MPFGVDSADGIATPIRDGGLGHHFEAAPDGKTYFSVLGPSVNLVASVRNLIAAQRIYLSYPGGRGRDQAAALGVILRELETAVHLSGQSTARFAEDRAKSLLSRRIVRPATPNHQHLVDAIQAREIIVSGAPGSWGAVGIGDIDRLDQFPYWKAQEFGSTHLVGKQVRGFFYDQGGNPYGPRGDRFRLDPVFRPGRGPKMIVQNPIRSKHFLTEATFEALEFRFRIWRGVESAAVAQTRSVRLATVGDFAGKPFSATVGGFAKLARYRP